MKKGLGFCFGKNYQKVTLKRLVFCFGKNYQKATSEEGVGYSKNMEVMATSIVESYCWKLLPKNIVKKYCQKYCYCAKAELLCFPI